MRTLGIILLALLLIGACITLGVTGIIDMMFTCWTAITTPGSTQ